MNRTMTHTGVVPAATGVSSLATGLLEVGKRILPLWRYAVFAVTLFAVLSAAASVRLDVQQMRKDLDRNARHTREARILNDRLRLELDARRRAVAMEEAATSLQLGPQAKVLSLEVATP